MPAKRENSAERKPRPAPARGGDVDAFVRDLEHPLKKDLESVRSIILGVSPEIAEAIKWNAPSYRTSEFFATFNLRSKEAVQLVFHRGAKAKDNATKMDIPDPAGLIEWLATDRCLVTLGAGPEIKARRRAFEQIVGAWIAQM